jgi:hypothetical protein
MIFSSSFLYLGDKEIKINQAFQDGRAGHGGLSAMPIANLPSAADPSARSCPQLVEQGLGPLQIERVEAFGKPAVDPSEKFAGLIPFALIAPQPRHAHRRAQFPGLCLLLALAP